MGEDVILLSTSIFMILQLNGNEFSLISVTLFEIVSDEHYQKAKEPIFVTISL